MSEFQVSLSRAHSVFLLVVGLGVFVLSLIQREWLLAGVLLLALALLAVLLRWLLRYKPQPDRWIWKRYDKDDPVDVSSRRSRVALLVVVLLALPGVVALRTADLSLPATLTVVYRAEPEFVE